MTTALAVPLDKQARTNHQSPQQIIDALDGAIDKARKSGDLFFFDSTMSSVEEDGVQVRYEQAAEDQRNRTTLLYFFLSPDFDTDVIPHSTNYGFVLRLVQNLGFPPRTLHQMAETSWLKRSSRILSCLHIPHYTLGKSSMKQRNRNMSFWCVARLIQRNPNERLNEIIDSAQQVRCSARAFLDGHQRWVTFILVRQNATQL